MNFGVQNEYYVSREAAQAGAVMEVVFSAFTYYDDSKSS